MEEDPMIVSMLEANVEEARTEELVSQFEASGESLPRAIVESFLLHDASSEMWRIVTVWENEEALDGYRKSVETPGGVLMFRSAGAEPSLSVFEVKAHADHP
jgi:hypothetical protein